MNTAQIKSSFVSASATRATQRILPSRILAALVVATFNCDPAGAGEAEAVFPAGHYELAVQIIMPHLDQMRQITTHEAKCMTGHDPEALFPVLRQPALRGCHFGYAELGEDGSDYVLLCANARVATGSMRLVINDKTLTGMMQIKMGGKNMTFSQRVVATRRGNCRQ